MADIDTQHTVQIVPANTFYIEFDRWNAKPLLPNLRRRSVVRTVGGAANIGMMRSVERPEQTVAVDKDRHDHRHVRQMTATEIRIIQQKDIAGENITLEIFDDFFGGPSHRAHMNGDMFGLRQQPAISPTQRHRKIPARI